MPNLQAPTETTTSAERLLGTTSLRVTRHRLDILHVLLENRTALSQNELEHRLGPLTDRVTVYRTLKTFVQEGLLHTVPDEMYGQRYALCDSHHCAPAKGHQHDHLHFKCTTCGDTHCLEDVPLPKLPMPDGFIASEITILAKGTCKQCATLIT